MTQNWNIKIGGKSKAQLLRELATNGVKLNVHAEFIFTHKAFTPQEEPCRIECFELSVSDLGFHSGGTFEEICLSAADRQMDLCPLEVGPHLRLQYTDQPEGSIGHPLSSHCAPPESLTIASAPLDQFDDTPKGFYLRKIDGNLWLRGYLSSADHVWSPDDRFLFSRSETIKTRQIKSGQAY